MKTFKYSLRALKLLIKRYPVYLLLEFVGVVCLVTATIIPVYLVKDIVDVFTSLNVTPLSTISEFMDAIGYRILIYVSIELGVTLIGDLMTFLKSYIERGFYVYIATSIFKKLDSIDYDYHESSNFLDNYTRALENGDKNIYNTATGQIQLIKLVIQSASLFAVILTVNYLAIVYAIIIGVAYFFLRLKINKSEYELRGALMPATRKRNYIGRVMYVKDSMADIKATPISDILLKHHEEQCDVVIEESKKYLGKKTVFQTIGNILISSIYPVVLGIVAYFVLETRELGSLASLTVAASTLSNLISVFINQITIIQNDALESKVSFELLDMKSNIEGIEHNTQIDDFSELSVNNISFAYNGGKNILDDVSLHIKKGEKIAIVGENGAGKTTLVKLLLRLYDVNEGSICYNGIPYTEITTTKLRKRVGAVFQQPEVYSVTVAENVLLRKCVTESDRELVIESLKFSDLYDYVMSLEDGIDTMVTREFYRRGTIFSGGQAQKLAVARGFAQNYELFILDEPSSSLDPIAETKMYHNMIELGKNKTLIFISHRLSAAVNVDRIYLFEKGKIIESGNHEELMKLDGKYKEMFDSQSEKYLRGSKDV